MVHLAASETDCSAILSCHDFSKLRRCSGLSEEMAAFGLTNFFTLHGATRVDGWAESRCSIWWGNKWVIFVLMKQLNLSADLDWESWNIKLTRGFHHKADPGLESLDFREGLFTSRSYPPGRDDLQDGSCFGFVRITALSVDSDFNCNRCSPECSEWIQTSEIRLLYVQNWRTQVIQTCLGTSKSTCVSPRTPKSLERIVKANDSC